MPAVKTKKARRKRATKGDLLNGRYRVIKRLGRGGMGTVFLVEDLFFDGRLVALKRVRQDRLDSRTFAILINEFHSLASLKHPNVARVYDFGLDLESDDVYFTIEYINGPHWEKVASKLDLSRGTDLQILLELTVHVLRALGFIHCRSLVHSDIKPENILIDGLKKSGDRATPTAKLIDFGLTKREKAFGGKKIVGTTYYIAPETIRGARVDRRADLYSLGVVLYHLVTGKLPFRGRSNLAVFKGHLEQDPEPPHEVGQHVPLQLSEIILDLMRKRPDDRPGNAFEVIERINREFGQSFELETSESLDGYLDCVRGMGRNEQRARLRSMFSKITGTEVLGGDVSAELSEISADADWIQQRHLDSSLIPKGQLVILRGEQGLGKRSLLETLRYQIETHGTPVIEVECEPKRAGESSGLRSFSQLVSLFAAGRGSSSEKPALSPAVAALRTLAEAKPLLAGPVGESERAVLDSVADELIAKVRAKPALIHFHDLHQADARLLVLIEMLVEKLADPHIERVPLLLTASALDHGDTEDTELAGLYTSSIFRRSILELKIERLDCRQVRTCLETTFAPCQFSDAFHEQVFYESDGNPESLVDILQYLLEKNQVLRSSDGWSISSTYDGNAVPGKIRRQLKQRIGKLPEAAIRLAIAFAYLGDDSELGIAVQLAETKKDDVDEALKLLRRSKIIEERVEGDPSHLYSFVHSSARDLLYQLVPSEQRAVVHDRAGQLYEKYLGEKAAREPKRLAFHYLRGENTDKAVRYGVSAARQFAKEFQPLEAIDLYRWADRLLGDGAPGERQQLRLDLADLYFQVGRYDQVIEVLEPVLDATDTSTQSADLRLAAVQRAHSLAMLGRFNEAAGELQEIVSRPGVKEQPVLMAGAFLACAELHASKGNLLESLRCCEKTLAVPDYEASSEMLGTLHRLLAENHYRLDNPGLAAKHCQDALRYVDGIACEVPLEVNLFYLGSFYKYKGKLAKAIRQFELCCQVNQRAGVVEGQARSLLEIGHIYMLLERPRDALEPLEQACVLFDKGKNLPLRVEAQCALGEAHCLIGEKDEGMSRLAKALDVAEELDNQQLRTRTLLAYADLHVSRGEMAAASKTLEAMESRESRSTSSSALKAMEIRFAMASTSGSIQEALELSAEGLALCRENEIRIFSTWLMTQRALLLCQLGSRAEARRTLVRLLDIAQAHDFELARGRAKFLEGVIALFEGRLQAAERLFTAAEDIFTRMKSERDLVELHKHFGMLRMKLGDFESTYLHFEEGVYLAKKLDLEHMKAQYQLALGLLELAIPEGTVARAEERFLYAERLAQSVPFSELLWQIQYNLGRLCQLLERTEEGEEYLKKASATRNEILDRIPVSYRQGYLKAVDDPFLDGLLETKALQAMNAVEERDREMR